MAKILIIEDDHRLCELMQDWLRAEGYLVEFATDGSDGLEKLQFYKYDLIILDWNLPGLSGIEVCQHFRESGGDAPILMLTVKSAVDEKTKGLDAGADDYLAKPFHLKELSARLRALLRRPAATQRNILTYGDLVLDPTGRKVTFKGDEIKLKAKEFSLLEFLMRYPNEVFSAEALMDRVWPSESDASPETVRIHIMRLRKRIPDQGQPFSIRTVHGSGYKLEVNSQ
ncbi:MAG: DNA-binding response regulator [Candidatus Melainabacteria bacterium]|nr:MAG: DNA-binding response regulator [Candidatus Melainabacteria bacterium]